MFIGMNAQELRHVGMVWKRKAVQARKNGKINSARLADMYSRRFYREAERIEE